MLDNGLVVVHLNRVHGQCSFGWERFITKFTRPTAWGGLRLGGKRLNPKVPKGVLDPHLPDKLCRLVQLGEDGPSIGCQVERL